VTAPLRAARVVTVDEIQDWLVAKVGAILKVPPEEVNVTTPFTRFGLESIAAVTLATELGEWLGRDLDATLLWDFPTIEVVAKHLAETAA
jgi:acyl carrier protein